MAEIETTYQVIKYEGDERGRRRESDGGWVVVGLDSGEMRAGMMLGWMKTTRGGRTRGWRD